MPRTDAARSASVATPAGPNKAWNSPARLNAWTVTSGPSPSHASLGTPASSKRSRCFSQEDARAAVFGSSGCGNASLCAMRAAIPTDQSLAGEITPSMCSASARRCSDGSSSKEISARRSASRKPGAAESRSTATTSSPCCRAACSNPSCWRPAPRTSRRRFASTRGIVTTARDGARESLACSFERRLRCFGLAPPARDCQCGQRADADEPGADPDSRPQTVDEVLRGAVAAVVSEDRGQHCDAKDATELADRVVGAGGLAFLAREYGAKHDVRDRREEERHADSGETQRR